MTRFPYKRSEVAIGRQRAGYSSEAEVGVRLRQTPFDDAADTLRLKSALKRAVAKSDAPSYLIDAIRREIRK